MPSHRETLKTWFRRVWAEEDATAIDDMLRPDMQARGLGDQPRVGAEAFKEFHSHIVSQLTGIQITIDRAADDGEWIWALCMLDARCRRSGKPVQISGQVLVRIEDGRLVDAYNHFDFMGLFQQLGLVPDGCFERCLCGEQVA